MKSRYLLIVGLVALVVLGIVTYQKNSPETTLSYGDFLKELERDCSDYEPNGAQYRECLLNLVEQRSNEIAEQYGQLITDLDANTDPEFLTARQTFKQDLAELYATWQTYRDQYCVVQADGYWGGSDQGGEFNRCRLYETEQYSRMLQDLREEWIRD
jgi:uncharacterized protein YecT (DUF1311 family)